MPDTSETGLNDLKQGFHFDASCDCFRCNFCDARYEDGIIYQEGARFMDARKAAQTHAIREHGSAFEALLALGKKATGLTDVQSELMRLFYGQTPDKEIAKRMGIAASTVRYQRHALREKARQAKIFLALSEIMEERLRGRGEDELVDIHPGATMVDDRYLVTEGEADAIIKTHFSSLQPLILKTFPSKQKKKIVILRTIAERFEHGVRYPGKEVDRVLGAIFEDYATLRRYLIEYGFMGRTSDGMEYWRT